MALAIILLIIGLGLLGFAADKLIDSSVRIAKIFKLSPLFIGLTILAIGTSAPELFLSAMSALSGNGSLSVGNIVGSNIFNLGFILGLSAIIAPILIQKKLVYRDGFFLIFITCLLFVFLLDQHVMWREGSILLALLVGYNGYLRIKKDPIEEDDSDDNSLPTIKNFLILFLCVFILSIITINTENGFKINRGFSLYSSVFMGLIAILFAVSMFMRGKKNSKEKENGMLLNITKLLTSIGLLVMSSDIIVDSAVYVATVLGVSEWAIGATIIAAGTSLPEVAATVTAIIKKKYDMGVGNVIGSDIFNILGIVGISSVITPLQLTPTCLLSEAGACESGFFNILMYDNLFSMGILIITLIITLIFMRTKWTLSKAEGAFLFIFACLRMAFEIKPDFFIGLF